MMTADHSTTLPTEETHAPVVRFFAHFFSYIFHPLFIPAYISAFLIYIHPSYFSGLTAFEKSRVLVAIGLNTIIFPGITVLLLKGLKFIDSIFLRTQKDRIIPYIASGTFFFWIFWVAKNQNYPPVVVSFMLGICIAAFAGLMANIYFKISMHAIGMGGSLGIFLVIMKSNSMWMAWPMAAALLITGIVCSSRLIISDHSQKEVYGGLLLGIVSQLAAAFFV